MTATEIALRQTRRKNRKTPASRTRSLRGLTGADRLLVGGMMTVPTLLVILLIWVPALVTVILSFTNWNGFGPIMEAEFIGAKNYHDIATIYPPFWPAIKHNIIWLLALFFVFTPLGMFIAVLLDREMKGSKFYQTSFYLPVVLSIALIGFIWQLIYSRDQGLLNAVLGTTIDWYGDPNYNLWAAIVANGWRHTGYVMLMYLAGLKGVDPSIREAASMDGAGAVRTYFSIVFPVMRPINIIVLVITVIEGLRAFDLVWVINRGQNGLELISTLVTANVIGEASRIGFGSALATIMLLISSIFIVIQLRVTMREER